MSKFKRGLVPTPRHRLAAALWAGSLLKKMPVPPTNRAFTHKVHDWCMCGNDTYGDCVVAEESNYKKLISTATNASEVEISSQETVNWYFAATGGQDTGMDIETAIVRMATVPLVDVNNRQHFDGKPGAIDFTNQTEVMRAIQYFKGIKIGIAADQLENTQAGYSNGWVLTGATQDTNYDHCVGLYGYGDASYLAFACGLTSTPQPLTPHEFCVLMYTWGTIGIVNWKSLQNICGEAWVRITDPDRGDAVTWTPVAEQEYGLITG